MVTMNRATLFSPQAVLKVLRAWVVNRGGCAGFVRQRQTHQKAVRACGSEFSSGLSFIERAREKKV